jgi:hypothetical protein
MFPFLAFLLVAAVGCIGISDGPWFDLLCRMDMLALDKMNRYAS